MGEADQARDEAIDRKRRQVAGLEVTHQEAHGEVCRDAADQGADRDLSVDVFPGRSCETRKFQDAGGEDDRRGEQEGEPRGVFMAETAP
jgi:hypothetical protein